MIKAIVLIATNTFKEAIRDRILLTLLVFSFLLFGVSLFLGSISLDQDNKIIIDFGLFGIFLFGSAITIFAGGASIIKELDQRTAYTILSRPIRRSWFILGKFFGLSTTLAVLTILMAIVFYGLVAYRLGWSAIDYPLILSVVYMYIEFVVMLSVMILFSSFSSSIMSSIYGVALFLIGHSTATMADLSASSTSAIRYIVTTFYYILPNLEKFNLRNDAAYHLHPGALEVGLVVAYGVTYCCVALYLASLAFSKQEL